MKNKKLSSYQKWKYAFIYLRTEMLTIISQPDSMEAEQIKQKYRKLASEEILFDFSDIYGK